MTQDLNRRMIRKIDSYLIRSARRLHFGWYLQWRNFLTSRFLAKRFALAGPLNLNIGAGNRPKKGWINTDTTGFSDKFLDATQHWNFSNSASYIYCEMVIGSLNRDQLLVFFKNCFAALRPNGALRVVTMNYREISQMYLSGDTAAYDLLKRHRAKGYPGTFLADILFNAFCSHYGYSANQRPYGVYVHDEEVIRAALAEAGFNQVISADVGLSCHTELCNLESRSAPEERLMNLILEATKA